MSLPGTGSVGPDGQYHYTLPLDVPEGRMGIAPKLSLNYSSRSGNGLLGVGWSLSGLSAIAPCPQIQAIDQQSLPVTMSGNDVLCLDGVRLLATSDGGGAAYQTEIESYTQITTFTDASTSAQAFQVQSQDGLTRIYKQRGKNKMTGQGLYWLLDTEYDANGNAVSYSYGDWTVPQLQNVIASVAVQEFAINTITYTNRMTSGSADTSGMRKVVFNYKSRPDPISMRYGASNLNPMAPSFVGQQAVDVHTSQLLSSIDMFAPIPWQGSEATAMVWTYALGYTTSTSTGRSLLTSVDKHGWQGAGNALTRTFSYDSASGLDQWRWYAPVPLATPPSWNIGNFGWGMLRDTGADFEQRYQWPVVLYGDLLHNGQTLLLSDDGTLNKGHITVSQITSSGLVQVPFSGLDSATLVNAHIVDLNGDGVPEIVAPNAITRVQPGLAYPGSIGGMAYSVYTLNVATRAYSETKTSVWYLDPDEPYDGTQVFGPDWSCTYMGGGATLDQSDWGDQTQCNIVGGLDMNTPWSAPAPAFSPLLFADTRGNGLPLGLWMHHVPYYLGQQGNPAAPIPNGTVPDVACQGPPYAHAARCGLYSPAELTPQGTTLSPRGTPVAAGGSPFYSGGLQIAQQLSLTDGSGAFVPFTAGSSSVDGVADPKNPPVNVEWQAVSDRNLSVWDVTMGPPDTLDWDLLGGHQVNGHYSVALSGSSPSFFLDLRVSLLTAFGDFDGRAVAEAFTFYPAAYTATSFDTLTLDWRVRSMDLDGDGRSEVIAYHLSNPMNPPQAGYTSSNVDHVFMFHWAPDGSAPQPVALSYVPLLVADFDGDGITDMIGGSSWGAMLQNGPSFYKGRNIAHDRVTRVSNNIVSNGVLSSSGYLLDEAMYTTQPSTSSSTGACGSYPVECSPGGMTVVSKHFVSSGLGGYDEHDYAYGTARFDVLGRGFLGFDWIDDFEPTRPGETISYYDNTSPMINGAYLGARPVKVTQYTPTAPVGSAAQITVRESDRLDYYNAFTTTGRAYTIQEYQWFTVEQEYATSLNWGSASQHFGARPVNNPELRIRYGTNTFDSYGNVTDATSVTLGGITTETKTDYYSPTTAPFLRSLVHDVYGYAYDPTTVSNPTARYVTYTYDGAGRVRTEVTNNQSVDETVQRTTTYTRSADGVITRTDVDALGTGQNGYYQEPTRSSIVVYLDSYEQMYPTMTEDAKGYLTQMLVNPTYGVAQDIWDANGIETQVVVDDFGRESSRSNAAGTTVWTSYARWLDAGGLVQGTMVSTTSGLASQSTVHAVDVRGHTILTETPHIYWGWDVSAASYDALGRLTQQYRPQTMGWAPPFVPTLSNGSTVTAYDPLDRVVSVTTPDTQVTSTSYTFLTATTTDPSGHQAQVTKDLDGRTTQTVQFNTTPGGYNAVVAFQYGQFGQVSSITQNNGPTWWFTYDLLGRRVKLSDPDSGTTTWTYNGFGDVLSETRTGSNGPVRTSYTYDPLGRVLTAAYGDGTASYIYDTAPMGVGKLAQMTSEDGVVTNYGYDTLGRPDYTEWHVPFGNSGSTLFFNSWNDYDSQGRVSTLTYPWSADFWGMRITTQDDYDSWSGALLAVTQGGSTLWQVGDRFPDGSLYYAYNANGEALYRGYDANGRVTLIEDQTPTGADIVNLQYAYNPDGTTQSVWDAVTGDGRAEGYSYDSLHQLTSWQVYVGLNDDPRGRRTGYAYDPFGNMTTVQVNGAYTEYNTYGGQSYISQQTQGYGPHQLAGQYYYAQGTGPAYAYDPAGRQTYAWGMRGQVVYKDYDLPKKVIDAQSNTTTFAYDAAHGRVSKSGGATGTTTITLGGLFEERLSSGGYPTEYVMYVPGTDGVTTQLSNPPWWSAAISCLHTDKLGNVVAITSSTASPEYFYYDPFGGRADVMGQATSVGIPDVQIGFTGQEMDDDLGLINMRGRIYDPVQRRFLSMDPFNSDPLNALSYNRYSYMLNSPTNGTDPSGFEGEFDWSGLDGEGEGISDGELASLGAGVDVAVSQEQPLQEQQQQFLFQQQQQTPQAPPATPDLGTSAPSTDITKVITDQDDPGNTILIIRGPQNPLAQGSAPLVASGVTSLGQAGPGVVPVPCGGRGAPACLGQNTRAKTITQLQINMDLAVWRWRDSVAPQTLAGPNLTIFQTSGADRGLSIQGPDMHMEWAVNLIADEHGNVRVTETIHGDFEAVEIPWNTETDKLQPGEHYVGFAHFHPRSADGGDEFSSKDVTAARDAAHRDRRFWVPNPTSYVVQGSGGRQGVIVFNSRGRGTFTQLPGN
jgi:RHS repeat-associated protein